MPDMQRPGVSWIYHRIRDYCEERVNGIGGFYQQEPYKHDFFKIFEDALVGGFCGAIAKERYSRRCSKLKREKPVLAEYVLIGSGIRDFITAHWLKDNDNRTNLDMVSTLCCWWDAWDYALSNFPASSSPQKRSRKVKSTLAAWIKEQEENAE